MNARSDDTGSAVRCEDAFLPRSPDPAARPRCPRPPRPSPTREHEPPAPSAPGFASGKPPRTPCGSRGGSTGASPPRESPATLPTAVKAPPLRPGAHIDRKKRRRRRRRKTPRRETGERLSVRHTHTKGRLGVRKEPFRWREASRGGGEGKNSSPSCRSCAPSRSSRCSRPPRSRRRATSRHSGCTRCMPPPGPTTFRAGRGRQGEGAMEATAYNLPPSPTASASGALGGGGGKGAVASSAWRRRLLRRERPRR